MAEEKQTTYVVLEDITEKPIAYFANEEEMIMYMLPRLKDYRAISFKSENPPEEVFESVKEGWENWKAKQ